MDRGGSPEGHSKQRSLSQVKGGVDSYSRGFETVTNQARSSPPPNNNQGNGPYLQGR